MNSAIPLIVSSSNTGLIFSLLDKLNLCSKSLSDPEEQSNSYAGEQSSKQQTNHILEFDSHLNTCNRELGKNRTNEDLVTA